jgi:hypothetical protein
MFIKYNGVPYVMTFHCYSTGLQTQQSVQGFINTQSLYVFREFYLYII